MVFQSSHEAMPPCDLGSATVQLFEAAFASKNRLIEQSLRANEQLDYEQRIICSMGQQLPVVHFWEPQSIPLSEQSKISRLWRPNKAGIERVRSLRSFVNFAAPLGPVNEAVATVVTKRPLESDAPRKKGQESAYQLIGTRALGAAIIPDRTFSEVILPRLTDDTDGVEIMDIIETEHLAVAIDPMAAAHLGNGLLELCRTTDQVVDVYYIEHDDLVEYNRHLIDDLLFEQQQRIEREEWETLTVTDFMEQVELASRYGLPE